MSTSASDLFSPKPAKAAHGQAANPLGDLSFIETQFPVSKMSKECYAERTAKQSQTLTDPTSLPNRKGLLFRMNTAGSRSGTYSGERPLLAAFMM